MDAQAIIDLLTPLVPGAELTPSPGADVDDTPALFVSAAHIVPVCLALRDTPGLEFLAFSNVTAVDYHPRRTPRFDVVYHVVSPHRRARVRLKAQLGARPAHRHRDVRVGRRRLVRARDSTTCSASCSTATPICAGS